MNDTTKPAADWQPVTRAGQVKVGDKLRFWIGDTGYAETASQILHAGTDAEEVIYNKRSNYYFITSMVIKGRSNHKRVEVLAASETPKAISTSKLDSTNDDMTFEFTLDTIVRSLQHDDERQEFWRAELDEYVRVSCNVALAEAAKASAVPEAPEPNHPLTTLLTASGARRHVRCWDGSGEPFDAYDKDIADRVVHNLNAEIYRLEARVEALGGCNMCGDNGTVGFPPDDYYPCPKCTPPAAAPQAEEVPAVPTVDEFLARLLPPPGYEGHKVIARDGKLMFCLPGDVLPTDGLCFYDGDMRAVAAPEHVQPSIDFTKLANDQDVNYWKAKFTAAEEKLASIRAALGDEKGGKD